MSDNSWTIEMATAAPERAEMDDLLSEYYALMHARLNDMGCQIETPGNQALEEFWDTIDDVLPPRGRLYLARTPDGALVGCGSLKEISAGKGELKRLFVRPAARGTGLGKALVDVRIAAARDMGMNELLVDTLKANVEMRGLYAKLGFEAVDFNPVSATYKLFAELLPYMCFFRKSI